MWAKNYMLSLTHKLYRESKWWRDLYQSVGISIDELDAILDTIYNNNFFDTSSEAGIEMYEKELNIIPSANQSLDDRRSTVRARWVASGKVDLALLQEVANSWKNGITTLTFEGGKIHVAFTSPIGVPKDLATLQEVLEMTKPAHLAIYYTFMYWVWGDVKGKTWGDYLSGTWLDVMKLKEEDY